jgi:hemolysin activation/secretion protein
MCLLGANDGLRGYPVGQYIDSALFSAQVEYRGRISESWGYVGFAGVGAVAPQFSGLIDREPLPSAGAGIRYRVSEKNQLDLSLDVTVSKADSAIYLYVGQSF